MSSEPPSDSSQEPPPVVARASSPESAPAMVRAKAAPTSTTAIVDKIDPYNKCRIPRRTVSSCRRSSIASNELSALPLIADATPEEKGALIIQKLKQCRQLFDFTNPYVQVQSKEVKRNALAELTNSSIYEKPEMLEQIYPEMLQMVAVNAFRPLPPPALDDFDPEEDEPVLEVAWPHLHLVYEVLLNFIESPNFKPAACKKYIDNRYVLSLIQLTNSEDPRERDFVKTVLHRIYGKFIGLRSYIRKEINNVFLTFTWETGTYYNGICELLEILGSIINGFAVPLKEEHKVFLRRVLMPLHTTASLSLYHTQLVYCVTQFLTKDSTLTKDVFTRLLKYWPQTSSKKEILFLGEVEEMLESVAVAQFQDIALALCKQLAKSCSSYSFQVTECSLSILQRKHFLGLLSNISNEAYPILVPALLRVHENHWNVTTRMIANFTLRELAKFDRDAYKEAKFQDERRQKREAKAPTVMRRTVEEEAARAGLN